MKFTIKKVDVRSSQGRSGETRKSKPKIYIFPEGQSGDETLVEQLYSRRNRPYKLFKQDVLPQIMRVLESKHPLVWNRLKDVKWGWRQDCGCSMCPCSPGFVGDQDAWFDIYVDVKVSG